MLTLIEKMTKNCFATDSEIGSENCTLSIQKSAVKTT
jgi:hypothetical protein